MKIQTAEQNHAVTGNVQLEQKVRSHKERILQGVAGSKAHHRPSQQLPLHPLTTRFPHCHAPEMSQRSWSSLRAEPPRAEKRTTSAPGGSSAVNQWKTKLLTLWLVQRLPITERITRRFLCFALLFIRFSTATGWAVLTVSKSREKNRKCSLLCTPVPPAVGEAVWAAVLGGKSLLVHLRFACGRRGFVDIRRLVVSES